MHRIAAVCRFIPNEVLMLLVVGAVRLAIMWTFAAFGEEFVYREYVLNRIGTGGQADRGVAFCSDRDV